MKGNQAMDVKQEPMAPTDADLAARGLPEVAFVDNRNGLVSLSAAVVAIKRGELGCYEVHTEVDAAALNARCGVTPEQREAMLAGSMFGWECKASFPETWRGRAV